MRAVEFERDVLGKHYSSKTSKLLASDAWWDGRSYERYGGNTFLYRAPDGTYFILRRSSRYGETSYIKPISEARAVAMYEDMAAHDMAEVPFEEAFPNWPVEEA